MNTSCTCHMPSPLLLFSELQKLGLNVGHTTDGPQRRWSESVRVDIAMKSKGRYTKEGMSTPRSSLLKM
ncbi:hypothetical protein PQX77_006784 [Marasmius sp. AFHP31]|nr:hypothetical protein PQX77_006784 [Marasmius sp. AFHP31]